MERKHPDDRHDGSSLMPIEDRLRELLAANDLPGLSLVLNGVEVRPMFSRRGGSTVEVDPSAPRTTTPGAEAPR